MMKEGESSCKRALPVRLEEPRAGSRNRCATDATADLRSTLHLNEVGPHDAARIRRIAALDERRASVAADRILDVELDAKRVGAARVLHHRVARNLHLVAVDLDRTTIFVRDLAWAEERAKAE